MTVALLTTRKTQHADTDLEPLGEALRARGIPSEVLGWDEAHDWSRFRLCVVRSTWDYHHRLEEFLAALARISAVSRLANPLPVIRWNTRKTYLRQLEAAGVPVVPTHWVEPGTACDLAAIARARGWSEAVVKPSVSAGAERTVRFRPDDAGHAQAVATQILLDCEALVQPYLRTVEGRGERSLLFCDGRLSHAIRKEPALVEGGPRHAQVTPVAAEPDELALAEQVLAQVPRLTGSRRLLYARVDTLRDEDGTARLMELELTEPFLFLTRAPGASERYAEAIGALLDAP